MGVEVISDSQLRITTEFSAPEILSILGMWVARPLPETVIETWSDDWTDPEHIVTSGAYNLVEWVPDDHILLKKSTTYYDADQVEIQSIHYSMVDPTSAWYMYLDGDLDSVIVPDEITPDFSMIQEVFEDPQGSIYYYGLNTSLPPFDNVLVRKAFLSAIDRPSLVSTVGSGSPTITFTPKGVVGYVDGYNEGIGIPLIRSKHRYGLLRLVILAGSDCHLLPYGSIQNHYTKRLLNLFTTSG